MAVEEDYWCEICNSQPMHPKWEPYCERCGQDKDYYDNLTPEERERDREAQAQYVDEVEAEKRRLGGISI